MNNIKLRIVLILIAGSLLIFSGCDVFGPNLSIDGFEADNTNILPGESVSFTVIGSTEGSGESDLTDYSGTIDLLVDGSSVTSKNISGNFTETMSYTFGTTGSYIVSVQLTGSDGTSITYTDTLTVTVEAASEGTPTNPVVLDFPTYNRSCRVDADEDSYYKFVLPTNRSSYTIKIPSRTGLFLSGFYGSLPADWDWVLYSNWYQSGLYNFDSNDELILSVAGGTTVYVLVESSVTKSFTMSVY